MLLPACRGGAAVKGFALGVTVTLAAIWTLSHRLVSEVLREVDG